MSLSFIKEIRPFPDYDEELLGVYGDPVYSLHRFVYDEANDELVVAGVFVFSEVEMWPANLYFDGETGEYKRGESAPGGYWDVMQILGYLLMIWSPGSFGKIYSVAWNWLFPTDLLSEISLSTRLPIITMAVGSASWSPAADFTICSYCMERKEAIVVDIPVFGTNEIKVYDCSDPDAPVVKSTLIPPGIVSNLCYENKELMWMITEEGIIAKFNYELANPRWEMLTAVQNLGGDTLGYNLTYDSKRKRVIVLRIRADADGKNQSSFEFYRPYYVPDMITDPVPVNKLVGGNKVDFVAHLLGSAGEGVAGQMIIPSLVTGANGQLLTNIAPTTLNGSFTIKYNVGNTVYSDELELECDVADVFA